MSIINHLYKKIINKSIKDTLAKEVDLINVDNYVDFINTLDNFVSNLVRNTIKKSFESIDQEYKHSKRRKELYYTKGLYPRTIMTLFGEITFEREYYVPKDSNEDGFFYVDKVFNLPKRDYYDPMIKALIIERSAEYSYTQSGKLVGDMVGKRFKSLSESLLSRISRQTVYNVIKSADMDYIIVEDNEDVETLYIQLDEKWVFTQGNDHKKKEIKAAVIYTDIKKEYNDRNQLVNRHVIATDKGADALRNMMLDYINNTYDVNKLRAVVSSGDGASWIKSSVSHFKFHPLVETIHVLDRFHMNQAINHITKDDDIKFYLRDYIKYDNKKSFKELCNALLKEFPERNTVITDNLNYIISNWPKIQNQSHPLFKGCSMEGHISHCLAALFTSRPKAHSLHMISKRLRIRELLVNNEDIKDIYLSNHVNPTPEIDYVELNHDYPNSIQDTIGYKVTEKYKWYKQVTNSTIFS